MTRHSRPVYHTSFLRLRKSPPCPPFPSRERENGDRRDCSICDCSISRFWNPARRRLIRSAHNDTERRPSPNWGVARRSLGGGGPGGVGSPGADCRVASAFAEGSGGQVAPRNDSRRSPPRNAGRGGAPKPRHSLGDGGARAGREGSATPGAFPLRKRRGGTAAAVGEVRVRVLPRRSLHFSPI